MDSTDALDLEAAHGVWLVVLLAIGNALLGMALGLGVSAFARTEFQAVQFMPALVLPQLLLCGLLIERSEMGTVLYWISWALPLTYSYDALGSYVAIPLGQLGFGALGGVVDISTLMVGAGVAFAGICLAPLLSPSVRGLRRADSRSAAADPTPASGG